MSGPAVALTAIASGTRFDIRVVPRASRTGVEGVRNGRVLVRVTAPPVDLAANDAAIRALADALDLPATAVRIRSGHTHRNKTVEIAATIDEVRRRLEAALPNQLSDGLER